MPTAYIDNKAFPFNPNTVDWDYTLNKVTMNTVGGRVTQILSAKIDTIQWTGEAGDATRLLKLYRMLKKIQNNQIENEISSKVVVPNAYPNTGKALSFTAWVRTIDVGWNVGSVTYPYRIQFEIDQDFSNLSEYVMSEAIARIQDGIGFNKKYTGLEPNPRYPVKTDPLSSYTSYLQN